MSSDAVVHVPVMYAEYSPRNGNAVSTVVHELCVASEALGRRSVVLVSEDRRHDYPDELVVADLGHPPGRQFRSRLARRFDEAVTTAVPIRPPAASRFYRCIADALGLTTGPVVVHNDPDLARVIRSLARDRRVYLHCHNELFTRRTRRSARATVRDVHGVICVSDFVARGVRKRTGDVARTIHVVRNGVDPSRFSPAAARRAGPPRILFVGKVVPHKGAHLLIDACVELASVEGAFEVEIVGSSDLHDVGELSAYERDLRAAARPLGERCTFRPFVDRHGIPDVYRQADIVAMPADWDDPCPLVLLEAMASGAAVVASARGGIREIGGDAVRYVDPRDRHAFATALAELVRDDGARRRLASRAREAAEQQSWRKAAEKLLDVCGA